MITRTIWCGYGDATKAYDELGNPINPRLVGCVMSLNLTNVFVDRIGESDGFTIYSVSTQQSVWDEWENVLDHDGYLN